MAKRERRWTAWGKKNTPVFIKLFIGTLAECGKEFRAREKEGGWKLVITRFGESPTS